MVKIQDRHISGDEEKVLVTSDRVFLKSLTMGLILISAACLSFLSPREDGVLSVATAAAAAAAVVRDDERRVVLAGERERLRRRPGERELERERVRCWKLVTLCWKK